jgi:hypothetical protein
MLHPNASRLVKLARALEARDPELYEKALRWYVNAFDASCELAQLYADIYTAEQVAGVIAALSPQVSWAQNLKLAEKAIVSHLMGEAITGQTGDNCAKAQRILDGEEPLEVLGGMKVRAFYQCILAKGQTDVVCVDRHAVAAWYLPGQPVWGSLTPKRYHAVAADYQTAARVLGLPAAACQAVVWCAWRRSAD